MINLLKFEIPIPQNLNNQQNAKTISENLKNKRNLAK